LSVIQASQTIAGREGGLVPAACSREGAKKASRAAELRAAGTSPSSQPVIALSRYRCLNELPNRILRSGFSKPFWLEQCVHQVKEQQQRDDSANDVFRVHLFLYLPAFTHPDKTKGPIKTDVLPSHPLAETHIPKRDAEEDQRQHDEYQVQHFICSLTLPL
jgi:hypothetical protein